MEISLVNELMSKDNVSLAPVALVVMDDEIWISGKGVSILGVVPVVTDPSSPEKMKIVPVTGQ